MNVGSQGLSFRPESQLQGISIMAIIRNPDEMHTSRYGESCAETLLAELQPPGVAGMVARRWSLKPLGRGPQIEHGDYEEMLYIISGSGSAQVGAERYPLQPESLLWLEHGDTYSLEAGPEGLEVLQYCAPGE